MKAKSLYQEIDEFMEDYLERIRSGKEKHFIKTKKQRETAYYHICNALGMIRTFKGARELNKKYAKPKQRRYQRIPANALAHVNQSNL